MKKSIFITVALFAFTSITSQLFAQAPAAKSSDWDLAKNKGGISCSVVSTEEGCSFNFTKIEYNYKESTTSGLPTGQRQHKPFSALFSVSSSDNSVSEVKSPRDAASGLPTGKRMHKPVSVSSSDATAATATTSGGGSGKVNVQDISFSKATFKEFTVTKRCGGKTTKISCESGDCEIPTGDCPNGDCALTASWSWGASQSGSSSKCSVDFLLSIEDGVCTRMAINEKGTGGTKGTTKK